MGRPLRAFYSGGIYHVISRGNDGESLFLDERHFQQFLSIVSAAKARFKFRVFAYCLMTNHFHFLLQQGEASLTFGIHSILNRYSHWFNAKNGKRGHVFQDRFRAIPCRDDRYFLRLLRYIHLNPVRAGLAERPEDWRWNGHGEIIERGPLVDRDFPLSFFAGAAIAGYKNHLSIDDALFKPEETNSPADGAADLPRNLPPESKNRSSLADLAERTIESYRLTREALCGPSRSRYLAKAKRDFVHQSLDAGISPTEIKRFLNCSASYISKVANLTFS